MTELQHISEKPWGDYTAADYTPEQYKAACLIVQGDGSTKDQCKLPVKTPNGALNRAGVHAAAAALAGARGGVDATSEEKAAARKKLVGYYNQLNEEPPPSLMHSEEIDTVLEHSGVKGMKWGVRNTESQAAAGKAQIKWVLVDQAYAKRSAQITGLSLAGLAAAAVAPGVLPAAVVAAAGGAAILSAKIALGATVASRVAYAENYLSYSKRAKARAASAAHSALDNADATVEQVYNGLTPDQKLAAHLLVASVSQNIEFADNPDVQKGWASMSPTERSVVLFLANVADSNTVEHSTSVDNVLEHSGVKGMKWGVRHKPDPSTGLVPRTGSADQIAQDRIVKKISTNGIQSLSNTEIQSYTRRLQMQKDVQRALAEQSAETKAKSDGFIKRFVKKEANRQFDRVAAKAIDVAIEAAISKSGAKISKKNPEVGKGVLEVATRLAPKKKGK